MTFWILRGFTLGPCKFGPLLEEILATPLPPINLHNQTAMQLSYQVKRVFSKNEIHNQGLIEVAVNTNT